MILTSQQDVLKALCLGATAVGLGRPFLYAQSVRHFHSNSGILCAFTYCIFKQAYGAEGAIKIVRILHREILTGMRLLGARNVRELTPAMVCSILRLSPCGG
jgi:L-lactate dehydrogenase (cytochrome)